MANEAKKETSRAHHYVPQFYLRQFTSSGKVTVIDVRLAKKFATNPKNVAQERDFNKIDAGDLPVDALEQAYAEFEGKVADALKRTIAATHFESDDDRSLLLNFIALLAIRNPRLRANFEDFHDRVGHQVLQLATSTKERWDSQVQKATAAGYMSGDGGVPYEEIRKAVIDKKFKLVTGTTEHARLELSNFEKPLENLSYRTWRFWRADAKTGGFVTSDHPVCLTWNVQPKGFAPLGYGLTGTSVYFPLSPILMLHGQFDGPSIDLDADAFSVGEVNGRLINNAFRQVYKLVPSRKGMALAQHVGIASSTLRLVSEPVARPQYNQRPRS
jgi:hypothetical protein